MEVYPAATLVADGIGSTRPKAVKGQEAQENVAHAVGSLIRVDEPIPALDSKSYALDAVICLLAAHDFLAGQAMFPNDEVKVRKRRGDLGPPYPGELLNEWEGSPAGELWLGAQCIPATRPAC